MLRFTKLREDFFPTLHNINYYYFNDAIINNYIIKHKQLKKYMKNIILGYVRLHYISSNSFNFSAYPLQPSVHHTLILHKI